MFFTLVLLTTFGAMVMITSAFFQNGLTPQEIVLLVLYALLILWVSTSFWTATVGFWVLLLGGDRRSIGRISPRCGGQELDTSPRRTALVMPIYNEDP